MLFEDYAEYESRARLLTEIHAMGPSGALQDPNDGPQPKKHAGDPMKRAGPSAAPVPATLGNGANAASTTSNSNSSTNNVAGKKKADKKRALRRL